MPYLIQGLFFQDRNGRGVEPYCFSGVIHDPRDGKQSEMRDKFGRAELENVVFTPGRLSFEKRYVNEMLSREAVHYDFGLQPDGTWLGQWVRAVGGRSGRAETGFTRCVVTEVEDVFFHSPDEAIQLNEQSD